ncbi:hypothetical protein NONI108955_22580 [Nocardia ninae]|uniref:Uncharacterized protein n=1 Tax=Nocardia ninae NBRC 108245 TaxID=1210091 RepID=A0A511MEI5_9NOCA|nr:hypothetical protein [Nocardia ninae]GEM38518.1 hypothetical protein NN4_30370 [Nocardia ninae NBRC 108245]
MSLPEFFIHPVVKLLGQTQSPYDVPADPAIFDGDWLTPTRSRVLDLLRDIDPETQAQNSVTGLGLTYLFIAADLERDYSVYLRLAGDGTVAPRSPEEKAVVLTLAGVMELEAYRHEGDVSADTPWYVRQFSAGQIYAGHPGTIHSVAQSPDAVQLVVSRGAVPAIGRQLGSDDVAAQVARARELLQNAVARDAALLDVTAATALAEPPAR